MNASGEYNECMQYTLRNIPKRVDQALRKRAHDEGKSLNEVTIETLVRALGLDGDPVQQRDLSDVAGSWVEDPEVDAALQAQRHVDADLWR